MTPCKLGNAESCRTLRREKKDHVFSESQGLGRKDSGKGQPLVSRACKSEKQTKQKVI